MNMQSALLSSRAVLRICGADARDFLQGLISNDMRRLDNGQALYAALLSPQGKFLHDFFLYAQGGDVLLDIRADRAKDLLGRLSLYKLRAQVSIALLAPEEMSVAAVWGEAVNAITKALGSSYDIIHTDPRFAPMGLRMVAPIARLQEGLAAQNISLGAEEHYRAHRIALCVPEAVEDIIVDKSLLLECGFEALHGVDFNKGCYVGQEVTARSKFRGQLRKMLMGVESADGSTLPDPGTPIMAEAQEAGEMRSCHGANGIAFLRSEMIQLPLVAGGIKLRTRIPSWHATN